MFRALGYQRTDRNCKTKLGAFLILMQREHEPHLSQHCRYNAATDEFSFLKAIRELELSTPVSKDYSAGTALQSRLVDTPDSWI